jgi:hypothetical protein
MRFAASAAPHEAGTFVDCRLPPALWNMLSVNDDAEHRSIVRRPARQNYRGYLVCIHVDFCDVEHGHFAVGVWHQPDRSMNVPFYLTAGVARTMMRRSE